MIDRFAWELPDDPLDPDQWWGVCPDDNNCPTCNPPTRPGWDDLAERVVVIEPYGDGAEL